MHINTINIHLNQGQPSMASAFLEALLRSPDPTDEEKNTEPEIQTTFTPPAIGAPWPGMNGIYAGIATGYDGATDGHLVLLSDKPAGKLNFKDATAWAEGFGDGFRLPTKLESALLYANLNDKFEREWHWTSTQYSSDGAWQQDFYYGGQVSISKDDEVRARAVRRLEI